MWVKFCCSFFRAAIVYCCICSLIAKLTLYTRFFKTCRASLVQFDKQAEGFTLSNKDITSQWKQKHRAAITNSSRSRTIMRRFKLLNLLNQIRKLHLTSDIWQVNLQLIVQRKVELYNRNTTHLTRLCCPHPEFPSFHQLESENDPPITRLLLLFCSDLLKNRLWPLPSLWPP